MANVRFIQVGERAGQRLDNFLLGQLKGVPRSRVYRMIRSGEVRVNGSRRRPNARLESSDRVRIPPIRNDERFVRVEASRAWVDSVKNSVLYEDDDLIVLDKPVGVAVHGGSGEAFGIAETLEQVFGIANMQLAHRLDKATSGCLVIAKNRQTLSAYHSAFRNNDISKTYDVFVEGSWPNELTMIDERIERFHLANGERRVRISDSGQRSKTGFEVVARCANATWLTAKPLTGRTHQIRIHARFAEHPILGDRKYGNRKFVPRPPRMMLHARTLDLPKIGELVAPVPSAIVSYWERLAQGD